jgi:hypothetical protein
MKDVLVYSVCLYHHSKIRNLPDVSKRRGTYNFDYCLLTDIQFECDLGWKIVNIEHGGRRSRDKLKICMPDIAKDYKYVVYLDNDILLKKDATTKIYQLLSNKIQFCNTEWRFEEYMQRETDRIEDETLALDVFADKSNLINNKIVSNTDLIPDTSFIIRKNDISTKQFNQLWWNEYQKLNSPMDDIALLATLNNNPKIKYELLDFNELKQDIMQGWGNGKNIKILSDKFYRIYPLVVEPFIKKSACVNTPGGYENTHPAKRKHNYHNDKVLVVQGHIHSMQRYIYGEQNVALRSPTWFHHGCMKSIEEWAGRCRYDYYNFDYNEWLNQDVNPWFIKYNIYKDKLYEGYDYIIWIDSDVYSPPKTNYTPLQFYRKLSARKESWGNTNVRDIVNRHFPDIKDFIGMNHSVKFPEYAMDTSVMVIPVKNIDILKPPPTEFVSGRWRDRIYLTLRTSACGYPVEHIRMKFCCTDLQYTKNYKYSLSHGCQFIHFGGHETKDMKLTCADLFLQWQDDKKRNYDTDDYHHKLGFYRH